MSLSVGIVGLPNVGKSTLFNALLKRQQAFVANFPFATIEPNIGVVPVPDIRLKKLAELIKNEEKMDFLPPEVPATVKFVDIAGLIAGASKGEGLGNKFLSHIRETSAICHVVRVFDDPNVIKEGTVDPKSDLEIVQTELALADLQTLEKQRDPGNTPDKELKKRWEIINKFKSILGAGTMIRIGGMGEEEEVLSKELGLLTAKPILVVLNVNEEDLKEANKLELKFAGELGLHASQVVAISAKIESEIAVLSDSDQQKYLQSLGVKESGLTKLIKKAFETLGLITFLTAGEKEVRAWTIKAGTSALSASGEIHTDFEKKFIKANVCKFGDFVEFGGFKGAKEKGALRSEGRDYVVNDGDVIEFMIGS